MDEGLELKTRAEMRGAMVRWLAHRRRLDVECPVCKQVGVFLLIRRSHVDGLCPVGLDSSDSFITLFVKGFP